METPGGIQYVPGETTGDTSSSGTGSDDSGMDEYLPSDPELDSTESETETESSPERSYPDYRLKIDSDDKTSSSSSEEDSLKFDESDSSTSEDKAKTDDDEWETDNSGYEEVTEWPVATDSDGADVQGGNDDEESEDGNGSEDKPIHGEDDEQTAVGDDEPVEGVEVEPIKDDDDMTIQDVDVEPIKDDEDMPIQDVDVEPTDLSDDDEILPKIFSDEDESEWEAIEGEGWKTASESEAEKDEDSWESSESEVEADPIIGHDDRKSRIDIPRRAEVRYSGAQTKLQSMLPEPGFEAALIFTSEVVHSLRPSQLPSQLPSMEHKKVSVAEENENDNRGLDEENANVADKDLVDRNVADSCISENIDGVLAEAGEETDREIPESNVEVGGLMAEVGKQPDREIPESNVELDDVMAEVGEQPDREIPESNIREFLDGVMAEAGERGIVHEDAEEDLIPLFPPDLLRRRLTTSPLDPDIYEQPLLPPESFPPSVKSSTETVVKVKAKKGKPVNKRGDNTVVLPRDLVERRRVTSPVYPVPPKRVLPTVKEERETRRKRAEEKLAPIPPPSKEEDTIININVRRKRKRHPRLYSYDPTQRPPLNPNDHKPWLKRSNPYCEGDGDCEWCELLAKENEEEIDLDKPIVDVTHKMYGGVIDPIEEQIGDLIGKKYDKNQKVIYKRFPDEIFEQQRYYRDIRMMDKFQRKIEKVKSHPGIRDKILLWEEYICIKLFAPVLIFLCKKVFRIPWILRQLDKVWQRIASKFLPPNEEDVPTMYWVHEDDIDDAFRQRFIIVGEEDAEEQSQDEESDHYQSSGCDSDDLLKDMLSPEKYEKFRRGLDYSSTSDPDSESESDFDMNCNI